MKSEYSANQALANTKSTNNPLHFNNANKKPKKTPQKPTFRLRLQAINSLNQYCISEKHWN